MHVQLVVKGRRAALFLGDADEPAMVVPRLALGPASGFVGFWATEPGQASGAAVAGAIANVVVRPDARRGEVATRDGAGHATAGARRG